MNYRAIIIFCLTLLGLNIKAQNISSNAEKTLYICEDGTVKGIGTNIDSTTYLPINIPNLTNVKDIVVGRQETFVLKNDSTIWAWGQYEKGFGICNHIYTNIPTPFSSLTNVISISAGVAHMLALRDDGTVWAWGSNQHGEIGNGEFSNTCVVEPVQVNSLAGITEVSGGRLHSLALKNDSTVWAWGLNNYGQLGNGSTVNSNVPTKINSLTGITSIAQCGEGGKDCSLALDKDGLVWSWGDNSIGLLGNGTNIGNSLTPNLVDSISGVKAIKCGVDYCMALKYDGTVWTWGERGQAESGNGVIYNPSYIPAQVSSLTDVASIEAGPYSCLAKKNDGTLWVWGKNRGGLLGKDPITTPYFTTPIQFDKRCNEPNNCRSFYFTSYDIAQDNYTLTVDSITSTTNLNYEWNFGDGSTSTLRAPSHTYLKDTLYKICLKTITTSNDTCVFCHEIGIDNFGWTHRSAGFTINVVNQSLQTNITQNFTSNNFKISPNPTTGIILIHSSKNALKIEVVNLIGEQIYFNDAKSKEYNLDLSNQPNGIYFVHITYDDNTIAIEKIILSK